MAKYRKKPVVIDAWHVADLLGTVRNHGLNGLPEPFIEGFSIIAGWVFKKDSIVIPTLEGDMLAGPDDMIIRGIAGEFYPCKRDIFAATYERVEE